MKVDNLVESTHSLSFDEDHHIDETISAADAKKETEMLAKLMFWKHVHLLLMELNESEARMMSFEVRQMKLTAKSWMKKMIVSSDVEDLTGGILPVKKDMPKCEKKLVDFVIMTVHHFSSCLHRSCRIHLLLCFDASEHAPCILQDFLVLLPVGALSEWRERVHR